MISVLPTPFGSVTIPRFFAPTALAAARDCRLRLVLQSTPGGSSALPPGPAAALGALSHRYSSLFATSVEPATLVFDRAHREIVAHLAEDQATVQYADLPRVLGATAWSRFRFALIDRTRDHVRARRWARGTRPQRDTPTVFGTERTLLNTALRLKGRADLIHRLPDGTIEIRDFKTGEIFDASGEIDAGIQIQLRCYGLLMLELFPGSKVRLLIDDGTEYEVPFALCDQRKLRRRLGKLYRELPQGARIPASKLASPGDACHHCPVRHRCTAYLEMAPKWWQATAKLPFPIPRDTWGGIVNSEVGIGGAFGVTLRDAAGRDIRVDRLDPARWPIQPAKGARLWAFNLESTISAGRARSVGLHPSVFYECPADSTQQRAWALQLFTN